MSEETKSVPAAPGFFSILVGVIVGPLKALKTISERPGRGWLIFALLAMAIGILPTIVAAPQTIERSRAAIESNLQSQPNSAQITDEQRDMALSFTTNPLFVVVLPAVGIIIGLVLSWLLWAGALYLLTTVLGGNAHFAQVRQLVVWSWIPFVLRSLVQAVYILSTGQLIGRPGFSGFVAASIDPAMPASLNTQLLSAFLGQLDLFVLWNLVLLMVGIFVTARVSKVKAVLIPLIVWIVFTLANVALAVGMSSITQGMGG